jgi:hypothetical protein
MTELLRATVTHTGTGRPVVAALGDVGGTDLKVLADPCVSPSGSSGRASETLRARLGLPVAENRYQEANRP